MSKYAMAVVIDDQTDNTPAEADTYVWEEVAAALNPGNGFLAKGITCAFVGGPIAIHDREEYDTEVVTETFRRYFESKQESAADEREYSRTAGPEYVHDGKGGRAIDNREPEKNGWLIEWDGGWATRDSEREAWIRVGELCADSEDSGYTAAAFKVSRNMPPPELEAGAMSTSDGLGGDDEGRLAIVGGKVRLPGDPGDNLYSWLSLEEISEREKQWEALAKIADDAKSAADVAEVVYQALEAIGKTTF